MATKMTRKRALEIAQECIAEAMKPAYKDMMYENGIIQLAGGGKANRHYAELAAALAIIEHMARQGELHL